jgi:hypothetical protein
MDELLEGFTFEELQSRLMEEKEKEEYKKSGKYAPFLKTRDTYYHLYLGLELISGEYFSDFPEFTDIKVSNLGRIMYKGEIWLQHPDRKNVKNYDYLYVDIPGYKNKPIYQFVAETYLLKSNPDRTKYNTVHHISNNGFDNRVRNLIYVTPEQHGTIHSFTSQN